MVMAPMAQTNRHGGRRVCLSENRWIWSMVRIKFWWIRNVQAAELSAKSVCIRVRKKAREMGDGRESPHNDENGDGGAMDAESDTQ